MSDIKKILSGAEPDAHLWRSLAEAMPDVLMLVDREGEILYINRTPAVFELSQILGTPGFDYAPNDARSELQTSLAPLFTGDVRRREQRVVYPDGTERWYATFTGPLVVGKEISAALVVGHDITDAKRCEFRLAESEARYRALVDYAPEAIVVFDVDRYHFVEVNQNACNLFGLSREALMASDPITLSPPLQPSGRRSDEAAWDYLRAALAGEVPSFEWVHRTSARTEVPCEVQLVRMPSTDSRLVRGCVSDITRRTNLEQQIRQWQKVDALGQFAGGIAHDFNNVLTMILATAELLAIEVTDDVHRADVQALITAARKGAALTSHLLSFARKRPVVADRIVDLNEVVRDIATIIRRVLGENISLLLELDPAGAPARIDRSEAEQIAMNLLLNARDAIAGAGTIRICTQRGQHGSHFTLLQVKDTGSGIEPEVKTRMFEPFFTTKAEKGTGLGLSTVYGIVTQAGGTIGVDSTVGVGTTMDVLLPGE